MASPAKLPVRPLTIAIVAGELSGDILGAGLMTAIKAHHPQVRFIGIGGPRMQAVGMENLFPIEDLAVMGIVEVMGRLPRLLSIKRQLVATFSESKPDAFIGIDAPDFNLRLELALKPQGIPTIHYVSPSVWAWRPKRIFKIERATNMVLALLPFEKAFYDKYQVPCEFVGHTLADEIPLHNDIDAARAQLGLAVAGKVVALLPGSRGGEVSRLGPLFIDLAHKLVEKNPGITLLLPLANGARRAQIETMLAEQGTPQGLILLDGQSRLAMQAADVVTLASGTATLEAMLVKRPMVVAYKLAPLTYMMAKGLMQVDRYSLPNLLSGEDLVPELIQQACTVENLLCATQERLEQDNSALIEKFTQLHQQIGCDSSKRAAQVVLDVLDRAKS